MIDPKKYGRKPIVGAAVYRDTDSIVVVPYEDAAAFMQVVKKVELGKKVSPTEKQCIDVSWHTPSEIIYGDDAEIQQHLALLIPTPEIDLSYFERTEDNVEPKAAKAYCGIVLTKLKRFEDYQDVTCYKGSKKDGLYYTGERLDKSRIFELAKKYKEIQIQREGVVLTNTVLRGLKTAKHGHGKYETAYKYRDDWFSGDENSTYIRYLPNFEKTQQAVLARKKQIKETNQKQIRNLIKEQLFALNGCIGGGDTRWRGEPCGTGFLQIRFGTRNRIQLATICCKIGEFLQKIKAQTPQYKDLIKRQLPNVSLMSKNKAAAIKSFAKFLATEEKRLKIK